jgi:hypothetical protein
LQLDVPASLWPARFLTLAKALSNEGVESAFNKSRSKHADRFVFVGHTSGHRHFVGDLCVELKVDFAMWLDVGVIYLKILKPMGHTLHCRPTILQVPNLHTVITRAVTPARALLCQSYASIERPADLWNARQGS